MTTTVVLSVPRFRAFTQAGLPMAGGKVYTYAAGTTTPKATYTDLAGSSSNANPVVLDSNGEATIRLDVSGGGYKIVLKDASDVTQWTLDDVDSNIATALGLPTLAGSNVWTGTTNKFASTEPRIILDDTDASSDKRLWDIEAQTGVLTIRTRTDADGAGKAILQATRGTGTAIATIAIGSSSDSPATTCWGQLTLPGNALVSSATNATPTGESGFYVAKPSDTSRNTTTTPADDPHLTLTSSGLTNEYILHAHLVFNQAAGSGGIKLQFSGATAGDLLAHGTLNTGAYTGVIAYNGQVAGSAVNATAKDIITIRGHVSLASGTPFVLQWAQNASDANNTTLKAGSFIHLTRTA